MTRCLPRFAPAGVLLVGSFFLFTASGCDAVDRSGPMPARKHSPQTPAAASNLPPEAHAGATTTPIDATTAAEPSAPDSTTSATMGTAPLATISRGPCKDFYAPTFAFAEGKLAKQPIATARPVRGKPIRDANFGACVVRVSDRASDTPDAPLLRNDYSRRQAFNADNTRVFAFSADGWWHLYDADTTKYLGKLDGPASDAEPQWHPADPNLLWYQPVHGGLSIEQLDIRSGKTTRVADFTGKLPAWAATAAHLRTRSEGSPSKDGRYWGFQVEDGDFGMLGFVVWDLVEQKLVGSHRIDVRPDHVSMTPSGRWFVSSGFEGTFAWSPDFKTRKLLHGTTEHSDIAIGANGNDIYVAIDYGGNGGDVFMVDIDACPPTDAASKGPRCPRTSLFDTYVGGSTTALHISGKGYAVPGWVIVSPYGTQPMRNGELPWFANRIFAMQLKANPRIIELADHHSVWDPNTSSYWFEPHASVNRDFTRIAFTSSWGTNKESDLDLWMLQIPAGAIR